MSSGNELQQKGVALFQQKEYEQAAPVFEQAIAAYTAEGAPDMAAEMQVNLGLVHRALGQYEQALELMQRALTTFTELGDARRGAMVLGNLGGVYVAMNEKEQAYECYREAAAAFDELGEKKMHADTLLAIASLQMKEGKIGQSASTYEMGLNRLDASELNASQRVLKGLISFRNRLFGGS